MRAIQLKATITQDGTLTARVPADVSPGEHEALLVLHDPVTEQGARPLPDTGLVLPADDLGPWPEGLSLRREEMYGERGR